jgi:hypothetical protein
MKEASPNKKGNGSLTGCLGKHGLDKLNGNVCLETIINIFVHKALVGVSSK